MKICDRKDLEYQAALKEQIEANKKRKELEKQQADEIKKIDINGYLQASTADTPAVKRVDKNVESVKGDEYLRIQNILLIIIAFCS